MNAKQARAHVPLAEALALGPPAEGNLAVPVFAHGTLEVEIYRPVGEDRQTPHARDEVYVVARRFDQPLKKLPQSTLSDADCGLKLLPAGKERSSSCTSSTSSSG